MARNCEIKAYVNKETKEDAKKLFSHWGLSLSDGINALLVCAIDNNGFPQAMKIENRMPISKEILSKQKTIGKTLPDGRTVFPAEYREPEDEGLYDE